MLEIAKMGQKCDLIILLSFLEPVAYAVNFLQDESLSKISEDLLKIAEDRSQNPSEKDIKIIDKTLIHQFYMIFVKLASHEIALQNLFGLAMILFKSAFIQKKMLGLSIIKEMVPTTKNENKYEWRPIEKLLELVEVYNLIENILGENANSEIIKKTEFLFVLLAENKLFESKYLKLLWKCSIEKHEDIIRASNSILISVLPKLQYKLISEIFENIQTLPKINEQQLKFIGEYTKTILKLIYEREGKIVFPKSAGDKKPQSEVTKFKLYDLDIFWNIIIDNSIAQNEEKIKDISMEILCKILNEYIELCDIYIQKALEGLQNAKILIRCIQFLKEIDFANPGTGKIKKLYYDIKTLDEKFHFLDLVIAHCAEFHIFIRKQIASQNLQDTEKILQNVFFYFIIWKRILEG